MCVSGERGGQKRAVEPLELDLQMVVRYCGCWGLNPGLWGEQPTLSTAEPSLQPLNGIFSRTRWKAVGEGTGDLPFRGPERRINVHDGAWAAATGQGGEGQMTEPRELSQGI